MLGPACCRGSGQRGLNVLTPKGSDPIARGNAPGQVTRRECTLKGCDTPPVPGLQPGRQNQLPTRGGAPGYGIPALQAETRRVSKTQPTKRRFQQSTHYPLPTMHWLPWDYGVRNLGRRPVRTALTAMGLALVVFLLLLVVGFVRGLELSLEQSGDPEVVLLHNANAAENLENSSVADEVPALARTEFAAHLVKYGEAAAVSPELTIAGRVQVGDATTMAVFRGVDLDRAFLVRRQVALVEGTLPGPGEVLVGRLAPAKLGVEPGEVGVGRSISIEGKPWRV